MREAPAGTEIDLDLDGFLAAVDAEVLGLGVRDHLDARRLVGSRTQWKRDELRDALAALLATDPEQLDRIARIFELYAAGQGRAGRGPARQAPKKTDTPGGTAAPRKVETPAVRRAWIPLLGRRRMAVLAGAGLAAAVALVLAMGRQSGLPGDETAPGADAGAADTEAAETEAAEGRAGAQVNPPGASSRPDPDTVIVEPRKVVDYQHPGVKRGLDALDGVVLALGAVLLFFAIRWWMLPTPADRDHKQRVAARSESARKERRRLAEESAARGDPIRLSYNVPHYLPIPRQALEDAAVLLGRAGPREPGRDLDVGATLRATLRQAGRLAVVFEERRALREILVLVDEERGDHPFLAGLQRVMEHLGRAGVALRRYRFQHVPAWLTPESGGPPVSMEELSRRYAGAHLVIFSRRLSPEAREGAARWIEQLPAWPVKAWLDPDPRSMEERKGERRSIQRWMDLGLRRFPWTGEGLLSLAAYLSSGGEPGREVQWPALPSLEDPRVAEALRKWALCAALVPDADWEQLEAIRRHPDFAEIGGALSEPWHLQRLLDWTAAKTGQEAESGDGRTLYLPDEVVDGLIREQRSKEATAPLERTLEARARRLLIQQLETERPDGELQRLRWMLKLASHRMVLEPARAKELLEGFFGTAVEEEAGVITAAEMDRQGQGAALAGCALPRADGDRLQAMRGQGRWVELRELFLGHGRLYATAIAGVLLFVFGVGQMIERLLQSQGETLRVTLPEIRRVESGSLSGGSYGPEADGGAPETQDGGAPR